RRRALRVAQVGGDDRRLRQVGRQEVRRELAQRVELVRRHPEERVHLRRVQRHREDPVDAGGLQEVRHQPATERDARGVLLVRPCVREVRHDGGDARGGRTLGGVDHEQELHEALLRRADHRLDEVDVALAAVLQELDLQAVVREALDPDRAQGDVEIGAHRVSEPLTSGTCEDPHPGHAWSLRNVGQARPAWTRHHVAMTATAWKTWAPFVDALRRSAPPGTRTHEFVGTVGDGAWQGTYTDDGDAAARREHHRTLAPEAARTGGPGPRAALDDALRAVAAQQPEQLVHVTATEDGTGDAVELITLPPAVVPGPGLPVLEIVLEPGALPAGHRATLAPRDDAAPAPSADPEAVARVVREHLPDAVGATPDEVEAARSQLPGGTQLPDEVRALYSVAASGALRLGDDDRFSG